MTIVALLKNKLFRINPMIVTYSKAKIYNCYQFPSDESCAVLVALY